MLKYLKIKHKTRISHLLFQEGKNMLKIKFYWSQVLLTVNAFLWSKRAEG